MSGISTVSTAIAAVSTAIATMPLGKRCYRSECRHGNCERHGSDYCLNEF
jgi:hypothetical protein